MSRIEASIGHKTFRKPIFDGSLWLKRSWRKEVFKKPSERYTKPRFKASLPDKDLPEPLRLGVALFTASLSLSLPAAA